jgi:hypothetical protein
MIGFIGTSFTITLKYNHNSSQSVTKTRSIPSWTTSVFHCDWLGSDPRVCHFFSFRCPLVNTPQLNAQLPYEWILVDDCHATDHSSTIALWLIYECRMNFFYNSRRTKDRTLPLTVHAILHVSIPRQRPVVKDICPANSVSEPLPSNGQCILLLTA